MNQNKYVIRLSFIVLFLNIIISIMLYRYFVIKKMVLDQVATENVQIADIYLKRVWQTHLLATNKLHTYGYMNLLQDRDFIDFMTVSADWFINLSTNISLYDLHGNKFMTSYPLNFYNVINYADDNLYEKIITRIDRFFLKEIISISGLNDAFHGVTSHTLSSKVIVYDGGQRRKASFITSYIPIIDNDLYDFPVDAVMEINTEVTKQLNNISTLEKRIFITFVIIFVIFCALIINNTNYARQIIEQQFDTNRNLEEAITRVEKESSANSRFLANVSHELRTPLNAIIGFSEILMLGKDNEKSNDYIKDINSAGKHLLSMINDILDLSKASADKLKVDNVDLDLNKLISSSMRLVETRAAEAKVRLIEQLPKDHIVIKADPKRLKQVLLNLLSNAVKFTKAEGVVTTSIEKNETEQVVYIRVADTGIGIEEKDIPKTLAAFGQIDSELSRKYEGTGLGLPLTKKLVELMNGKFDLQSKIGEGTVVTLTFNYDSSIEV